MGNEEHQEKSAKRLATLTPNGDEHRTKCGDPAIAISEVHHILCCTCMARRFADHKKSDPETADYIERCLDETNWNINDGHNLIRLPKKKQYFASSGAIPVNLPCHDVDHPMYTDEVSDYLKNEVWNTLCKNREPHQVNPRSIKAELEGVSAEHRAKLIKRGGRKPGTTMAWDKRHDEDMAGRWYKPFSMAAKPSPRSPGARTSLAGIFDKLK